MAEIDWPAAITALDTGDLPCSGGEQRMLQLTQAWPTASPSDLRDTLTGLDDRNIKLVIAAILHASGHRPPPGTP